MIAVTNPAAPMIALPRSRRLSKPAEHPCNFSLTRCDLDVNLRKRRAIIRWTRKGNGISASASSFYTSRTKRDMSHLNGFDKALKVARDSFMKEVSFQSKDQSISLSKALLYIAAEDEAFNALNNEIDACYVASERDNLAVSPSSPDWDSLEQMSLSGKTINSWLIELDIIAQEVQSELESRKIGSNVLEILDAVNVVLFDHRRLKRSPVGMDSDHCYLHSALRTGQGSAILLCVIYIEVCERIKVDIVGSRVGEDFLIWPDSVNPEELFNETSGQSLFAAVNGRCVNDPKALASDLTSTSLEGLEIASKRDIIGIALANLMRIHWKSCSRSSYGLMLTSPLRQASDCSLMVPSLGSRNLRLAIMATERLLVLQPHNWSLRRDHGMMLFYIRDYAAAVRELSICMAFAPDEEAQVLEPFVEKLHLLRLESSWNSCGQMGQLAVS